MDILNQEEQRQTLELENCIENMSYPVFGYPLMNFKNVPLHQIPPEYIHYHRNLDYHNEPMFNDHEEA